MPSWVTVMNMLLTAVMGQNIVQWTDENEPKGSIVVKLVKIVNANFF